MTAKADRAAANSRRRVARRTGSGRGATARRNDRAQRPQRRPAVWLNRLLVLVAVLAVTGGAVKAYLVVEGIPVQRIQVTGELQHTRATAVKDMVQSSLAGGFLRADLQLVRRQLENLPWVFAATVRRRWPGTLQIHVVEQLPIARWGENGFLNFRGDIFHSAQPGDWSSLPMLAGPEGSAAELKGRYQQLLDILAPLDLRVQRLEMDKRGQLEATLDGGMLLVLGNREFFDRLQRFVTIYRNELVRRKGEIERVDMRYASGVAVAFTQTSQVAGL